MALIEMRDVTKKYRRASTALRGINLMVNQGEFVYLVGPSGAGKSSFIKLLYREEEVTSGQLKVGNVDLTKIKRRNIPKLRRSIGVVFQDFKLLPTKTVYENVAFAMQVIEAPHRKIKRQVMNMLDLVGLRHRANAYPNELSGGEQQRIAIARAIVNDPVFVIADEPTGNLDPETSWDIMEIFKEINDTGTTIVMATHDKEVVDAMGKRVIAIEHGRIVRDEKEGVYGYEL